MSLNIDPTILDAALAGDRDALNGLVAQVRPHVERQLLRYPVTDEDRRDLVQATLMQVVRRLDSFRGDSSFSTWLFRVTANAALMMMRSQRRLRARVVAGVDQDDLAAIPVIDADGGDPTFGEAARRERDARVRTALAGLPSEYRDVVVAHYHLDLGLQEIADKLDLTESAVRSRLHRARSRLRTLLESSPVGVEALEEAALTATTSRRAASVTAGATSTAALAASVDTRIAASVESIRPHAPASTIAQHAA